MPSPKTPYIYTPIQTKTVGITATRIGQYLAVNKNGELPAIAGESISGFTLNQVEPGEAIGVVSRGNAWAIASGAVVKGNPLVVTIEGKVTVGAGIVVAKALEDGADGEVIKIEVYPNVM